MPVAPLDEQGNVVGDNTVDPTAITEGQLVYLYGYEPAIVFGVEPDGTVEIGRFGELTFTESANLSSARGPRPDALGPEPESPQDRVAALEKQLSALTALLSTPAFSAALQAAQASQAAAPLAPAVPTDPVTPPSTSTPGVMTPPDAAPESAPVVVSPTPTAPALPFLAVPAAPAALVTPVEPPVGGSV